MKEQRKYPPRWAERFLEWYCKPSLLEDLQGDLNEYFDRNVKAKGLRKARIIYVFDVLKFMRLYTLRKPEFFNLLTHWIMIGSYVKTSGRTLVRNKLFSSINIIGLATSMSVALLMIALLSDMNSYDRFHENYDRIYRVTSQYSYLDRKDPDRYATTSLKAASLIGETIPGIESTAVFNRTFRGREVKYEGKVLPISAMYANEDALRVFTFPLIHGNQVSCLKEPFSVVMTESYAVKLFGNADVTGKAITFANDTNAFQITAVLKDVPAFSHIKFDVLISLSTRDIIRKGKVDDLKWDSMWDSYTYILLKNDSRIADLQQNLDRLSDREDKTVKNTSIDLFLQPISQIALGEQMNNSIGPVMGSKNVWVVGILSVLVIISACFNYTNLSIARSLRRSKEVGVRKVVGALKSQVWVQFIVESIVISLLSLVLALLIFQLAKPFFLSLNYEYNTMLRLELSFAMIGYFVLLAIAVGVIAGFFPALLFAKTKALSVLKNFGATSVFRNMVMRKALIVTQFTISLIFIAGTIIGFKHYKQVVAFDLGFNTANILNIDLQGKKGELFMKELSEIPEISEMATSELITSVGNYWGSNVKYINKQDSAFVYHAPVDENYIPLLGHKLLAGRNFTKESGLSKEIIINQKIAKRFNIGNGDPMKVIGEPLWVNRVEHKIVGVVEDFYYGKAIDQMKQDVFFAYNKDKGGYVNAKVLTSDWDYTRAKIEAAWKKIDPDHPLDAKFYDEQIEQSYADYASRIKMIGSLAVLAIVIASIGLIGMVVFTTEIRMKEISIRKVLGATEAGLIFLLNRGFIVLLVIAAMVAFPLTQFFFVDLAFDYYGTNAPGATYELIAGFIAVLVLATSFIAIQTLKAARSNPAEVLKTE
jgi:putative ABC transport system permease protein